MMVTRSIVTISGREELSVFLFAAPWMKASWPCLGIGLIKAFLNTANAAVRCSHFHLEAAATIGWGRYDDLAETWGAGEALFGALLDPQDSSRLVSVAVELLTKANRIETAKWAEDKASEDLRSLVDAWLERERPDRYQIVGGSVGAMQLCSTLYLIKRVRECGHAGWRILGGAGLVGSVSRAVLERCPDIDAVVDGEGEHAMLSLIERMQTGDRNLSGLPRVISRDLAVRHTCCSSAGVDLSTAPAANLDEYFESAHQFGVPLTALNLSFEYSRGCEWEHRKKDELRGCTFCGLYRNSSDHRRMPVERILRHVEDAVRRYHVLDVSFVDAYLPLNYRDELLDGIIGLFPDISIFTEMRCDLSRQTAERLSFCARRIQFGVESFTNAILRRIGKGTRIGDVVYSLRVCQELGINLQYNLMTHIPGVSIAEIDELQAFLPKLFGLIPPNIAEFYLDRNSLIFKNPEAFGIDTESLDLERPEWLTRSLGDGRISQIVPFNQKKQAAAEAWNRVTTQVSQWRERFLFAKSIGMSSPLVWRDGGSWASIVDARNSTARIYSLEGVLYDVFAASSELITERELAEKLKQYSEESIAEALRQLLRRDLLILDGSNYLSLPVHSRGGLPAGLQIDSGHRSLNVGIHLSHR